MAAPGISRIRPVQPFTPSFQVAGPALSLPMVPMTLRTACTWFGLKQQPGPMKLPGK